MAGRNLVFVVNSGSSSLKFSIFKSEPSALQLLQGGIVERIGDTANSRLNVTAYRSGREPDKTSEQTAVEVRRLSWSAGTLRILSSRADMCSY